jgi:hypothetical protein
MGVKAKLAKQTVGDERAKSDRPGARSTVPVNDPGECTEATPATASQSQPAMLANHPKTQGAMLTMDQAWERIGKDVITKQALYLAAARGEFPSIRVGKRILVPRAAFEGWLVHGQPAKSA